VIVERDVVVEGIRIHYAEAGPPADDPPILLIHGLGSAGVKFHDAMPLLAEHRRTIAIDLPGFGFSDAPRAPYSPAWQAGGVRAFLDALEIERAIIAGNSYGGLISVFFASAWPDRTAALALVAAALPNDGARAPGAAQWVVGTLPLLGPLGQKYYWGRPPSVVVTESVQRNCADPARVSATMIARLLRDAERKDVIPAYRRATLAAQRATLWALTGKREQTWRMLSTLRPPTVLIWGEQDQVIPLHVGRDAVSRLPGAHLIVIDECGHNPQMEKPDEFAQALLAFMRATEAGEPPRAPSSDWHPEARDAVRLAEYDVRWPLEFEQEKDRILAAIGPHVVRVEHIGSTAVPGLASKPVIDMCVTVPSLDAVSACLGPLEALGYEYQPEAERAMPDRRFLLRSANGRATHHLHMFPEGHPDVDASLRFRDRLRADPTLAREYEQLKHRLSQTLARAEYTEAKGPFIRRVLDDPRARA